MKVVCCCIMVLALVMACSSFALAQDAEETYGCEANPTGNPIGGGEGYSPIFTKGDFTVTTKEELLDALKKAQPEQVIFVPDGVEIDLTGERNMKLPAGVTLAGTRGLNGSKGARLFTTLRVGHTLMATAGDKVRLTGLRFEGPYGGTEKVPDHCSFMTTSHYGTEVDNCEVYNWNHRGVTANPGGFKVRVHHNYIHHCQRSGYGYGVRIDNADVYIIANKFDYCRHHIASSGAPGCSYEAAWNHVGEHATSHHFDMHGGRDRGDNTDIAGDWIHIHHNTFVNPNRAAVIRGVPSQWARIHNNWFAKPPAETIYSGGNTRVYSNVHGPEKTKQEKPIQFVGGKPVEY